MPRGQSPRPRRPPVNRHFKIEHVLPPEVMADYRAHLRDPGTTVDTAHAWLCRRGFGGRFSRSAVARHKRHYLQRIESQRQSEDSARMFAALASNPAYGDDKMLAGALLSVEQQLLMAVFELRAQGHLRPLAPEEIKSLVEVMSRALDVRKQLTRLRRRQSAGPGEAEAAGPLASKFNAEEIAAEVRAILDRGGTPRP